MNYISVVVAGGTQLPPQHDPTYTVRDNIDLLVSLLTQLYMIFNPFLVLFPYKKLLTIIYTHSTHCPHVHLVLGVIKIDYYENAVVGL